MILTVIGFPPRRILSTKQLRNEVFVSLCEGEYIIFACLVSEKTFIPVSDVTHGPENSHDLLLYFLFFSSQQKNNCNRSQTEQTVSFFFDYISLVLYCVTSVQINKTK